MKDQLKIKKEVTGTALIDLGAHGSMTFERVSVYMNEWSEKEMVMLIVDKNDPNNKIQLTFDKPAAFVDKVEKPEEQKQTEEAPKE